MYDVMGFMQQLQREAMMAPENAIVPNTLSMALQLSPTPRMIIKCNDCNNGRDSGCGSIETLEDYSKGSDIENNSSSKYQIIHINRAWTLMKGITKA